MQNLIAIRFDCILGDPGAVSGGGKKSKRARKNSGEEKSRRRRRAPGDKVLKDQFQTVRLVLASDWCQKTFVFFCPIAEQQDQESFRVLLHDRYIQASCSPCYSRRKVSITAQNVGEIVRHIRKKLATNTLDLFAGKISGFNRLRVFVHFPDVRRFLGRNVFFPNIPYKTCCD